MVIRLDRYSVGNYTPGAALWKQLLWYFIGQPLVKSYFLPFSMVKVSILRLFGAKIGKNVRIKPGVQVKFPWRLSVGNSVWIGEKTWLDNLESITIEDNVCISQQVYFCTGNHDWSDPYFQLIPKPILIKQDSWIGARAVVGPGITVGEGAVLCLGSVTASSLEPMTIYVGNPAIALKKRIIKTEVLE